MTDQQKVEDVLTVLTKKQTITVVIELEQEDGYPSHPYVTSVKVNGEQEDPEDLTRYKQWNLLNKDHEGYAIVLQEHNF